MISRERYYAAQHMNRDDSLLFNKFADDELKGLVNRLYNQRRDRFADRVKFMVALTRQGWNRPKSSKHIIKMQRNLP